MAGTAGEQPKEAISPSKEDFHALAAKTDTLEAGILTKISDFLSPITEKLDQMMLSWQKVASIAEGAVDLSTIQQGKIKALQELTDQ